MENKTDFKTLIIDGRAYMLGPQRIKNCLDLAKDKFKRERKHAIYAIEKDGIIEMKKNTYADKKSLNIVKQELEQHGFKVYWDKNMR